MNKKSGLATAFIVTFTTCSAAWSAPGKEETDLLNNIARDGMLEVQLGKLAEKRGTSAEVLKFGKHMVTDHSKANDELKQAAAKENVTLPADISPEQKQKKDKLAELKGAEFDRKYMEEMVAGHKKAIEAIRKETEIGTGATKGWAEKTLPVIEEHKKEADKIDGEIATAK